MFAEMAKIIPEGRCGLAQIKHRTPNKSDIFIAKIHGKILEERLLATLFVDGKMVMSDSSEEHRSNSYFVYKAKGKVLIAGLGIGMVLNAILIKKKVQSVWVIEKYQDVINLVAPYIRHTKLKIECADIFEWKPPSGFKFDTIYFDIWADICTDNLSEIAKLHKRFKSYKSKDGWMGSWNQELLRYYKRQGR